MKEIRAIVNAYNTIDFLRNSASLATVVRVEGSSYRRTGARMLVLDNGTYLGGISGGCLEGDALRRAQKAITSSRSSVITYDTTQDDARQIGAGLGCNGIIDVMFTPIDAADPGNPVKILSTLITTRLPRVVVSITGGDEKMDTLGKSWLYENDDQFRDSFTHKSITDKVLKDIAECLKTRTSKTITFPADDSSVKIFIEVILPVMHLVVYGGNYDIYPIVRIAGELGWDITVVTNITKTDKSLFSLATKVLHNKSEEQPLFDDYTAIILMTHDYKTDFKNLQKALLTNVQYIGILGPRKRGQKMFDAIEADGKPVSEETRKRIFVPAGLDIGANSPEEIALSIIAEIISHFSGRGGTPLRHREGTIHEE